MLRIAVIGGSSGIGREAVRYFSKRGDAVFVMARRKDRLEELKRDCSSIWTSCGDVGSVEDIERFVSEVRASGECIDALINCAGSFGAIGPCDKIDLEEWWSTLRVNLFGTIAAIQKFVPLLEKSSSPRIINFSGGGAFQPFPNYSAYAVSKAGVVRLTETLAVEFRERGIAVNALAPGFVVTEIHESTLQVGEGISGSSHYELTKKKLSEGAVPIDVPIACLDYLVSSKSAGLTGKTISASFDPWREESFSMSIDAINGSDLYTMQRINLTHLGIKGVGELK